MQQLRRFHGLPQRLTPMLSARLTNRDSHCPMIWYPVQYCSCAAAARMVSRRGSLVLRHWSLSALAAILSWLFKSVNPTRSTMVRSLPRTRSDTTAGRRPSPELLGHCCACGPRWVSAESPLSSGFIYIALQGGRLFLWASSCSCGASGGRPSAAG